MDGGQNQLNANNGVLDKNERYIVKNIKQIETTLPTLKIVSIVVATNNNKPTIPSLKESGILYQVLYNTK